MGKKYIPNGYQIIDLDLTVSEWSSEESFTVNSDDAKILYDILTNYDLKKPILLHLSVYSEDDDETKEIMQMACLEPGIITFGNQSTGIIGYIRRTNTLNTLVIYVTIQ